MRTMDPIRQASWNATMEPTRCAGLLCCDCEYFMTDHGGNPYCEKYHRRAACPHSRTAIRDCEKAICRPGGYDKRDWEKKHGAK